MNRGQKLAKNTIIITIGKISTQFVSFLLLPFYTTLLTTEDYGIVDFITTIIQLLIPIASLMIEQSVFRFILECKKDEEKKEIISNAIIVWGFMSIIVLISGGCFSLFINSKYNFFVIAIIIATTICNMFLQIARGIQNINLYSLGSFICSIIIVILNIVCIVGLKTGAIGILIATLLGNLLCAIFLFYKLTIYRYISLKRFNKQTIKELLKFSLPLVPNQMSLWIMNSSDRFIVTLMLGASANGILAISHKFPSIYMTFFGIFLLAWQEFVALHYNDEDRENFLSEMCDIVLKIFASFCVCIVIILPLIFNLFVNEAYAESYYNIPIYMIAFLFNIVIGILGAIYVANKKTIEIVKTTSIAAIVNIISNFILIKYIGLYAASISTLIGYVIAMIYRIKDTRKYIKINYKITTYIKIVFMLLVSILLYYINNKVLILISLPIWLIVFILFNKDIVDYIKKYVITYITKKFSINKIKRYIIYFIIIFIVLISTIVIVILYKKTDIAANYFLKEELTPQEIIFFEEFGQSDFTCTGITYDSKNETFWLADNGANKQKQTNLPRIIEVDTKFSQTLHEIPIFQYKDINLQGITYDKKTDTFWLAIGDKIINIDKTGNEKQKIELEKFSKYAANGIWFDENTNTIFVLCYKKYLLQYDLNGKLVSSQKINHKDQDHIIKNKNFFITIGADYQGDDNYIFEYNEDFKLISTYRMLKSHAIEGLYFKDNKIYILNDGNYHNAKINKSYITIYDFK